MFRLILDDALDGFPEDVSNGCFRPFGGFLRGVIDAMIVVPEEVMEHSRNFFSTKIFLLFIVFFPWLGGENLLIWRKLLQYSLSTDNYNCNGHERY